MRTETIQVYQFDELTPSAKQTAIEWYRGNGYNHCQHIFDECFDTFRVFADLFNVSFRQMDFLEMYRSEWSVKMDENILNLSGFRLAKYLWNNYRKDLYKGKYYGKLVKTEKDGSPIEVSKEHPAGLRHVKRYSKCQLSTQCVFTGVCYDESILAPIYQFLEKPVDGTTFEELISECIYSLAKDLESEFETLNSEESIIESIQANEYEFTESGEHY